MIVTKPSEYRVVLRYVNPTNVTSTGTIKIIPEGIFNPEFSKTPVLQSFPVILKPSSEPTFTTVPGPLVMNSPGAWTIRIALTGKVYLDYFVLLPAAFYEATILEKKVEKPCLGDEGGSSLCRNYAYPPMPFNKVGPNSFYVSEDKLPARDFYDDPVVSILNKNYAINELNLIPAFKKHSGK